MFLSILPLVPTEVNVFERAGYVLPRFALISLRAWLSPRFQTMLVFGPSQDSSTTVHQHWEHQSSNRNRRIFDSFMRNWRNRIHIKGHLWSHRHGECLEL